MEIPVDIELLRKLAFNSITQEQWNSFFEWCEKNWPKKMGKIEQKEWFKANCGCQINPKVPDTIILNVEGFDNIEEYDSIKIETKSYFTIYIKP